MIERQRGRQIAARPRPLAQRQQQQVLRPFKRILARAVEPLERAHKNGKVMLVAFRAGWGLGNAFFVVTALSVLVAVTRGGTGRAVLIYEAAMGLGLSVGPLLGAALGAQSWRWPFFGTATLMAVGLVSALVFLPSRPRPAQKTALSAPIRALAHPGLFTVSLAAFFYYFAFFAVRAFAPFVLDLSAHAVGAIFFGWGLMLALFSVFVAPRVEARFGLVPVVAVALVALAVLLVVMGSGNKPAIAAAVILSGAIMGVCNTLFTELALEVSDVPRPVASAGYNFLRWFAGVVAPWAVPTIAEHGSVLAAFSLAALAALLAPATLWLRRGSIAHHKAVPGTAPAPGLVVAAVDGSDADARVINRAVALAKATGKLAVLALHVRVSEVLDGAETETEPRPQAAAIVARARARIAAAGGAAQGEVLHATPGQAVRATFARAEAGGAAHVVIGAPHAGALDDLLHGSFARAAEAAGRQAAITVQTVD